MGAFRFLAAAGFVLLSACATPGPILNENVGAIRTGVGLAREEAALVFERTNQTARDIDVARVLAGPAPNLREEDFPLALAREDIVAWGNAFSVLDGYLAALQSLVGPGRAGETATALDGLAAQLREGPTQLALPGPATAAFSTFAGALVQLKAERSARDAMLRADPAFKGVTTAMADAIGPDDRAGLRQTTRLYWAGRLADIRADYSRAGAAPAGEAARKAAAARFVEAMDARDTQLGGLAGLRSSLLALGEAHGAAARGSEGDALFWIGRIGGWLDEMKRRTAEAEKAG